MAKSKHAKRRRRSSAFRARTRASSPGSVPGALRKPEKFERANIEVYSYGPDSCEVAKVETVADIARFRSKQPVTWINVDGVADTDVIGALGDALGLHPLALEDVANVSQRPKVDDYGDNVFIVLRMPGLAEDQLDLEQVSMFVGKDFLLTFQERPGDCLSPVRDRIRESKGRIRDKGVDYLAYAIIDAIVDQYFPVLEKQGDLIEEIENIVLGGAPPDTINEAHALKHDLVALRRALWPSRDVVGQLAKGDHEMFSHETRIFLRDCVDHAAQLIDILDGCREMVGSVMDLHLSALSQRMNEIMKVLTLIATVFIPLGFIAGLYGMNFDPKASPWNMPELGLRYGYPLALGVMGATALGFLWYFRRKGWIGRRRDR